MIKSGEKKQVRRRLHTSRPYQERLLNMAEARREIVTALKYHRASMKQQQIQQANSSQFDHPPPPAPFYWPPPVTEDFPLPNQTLGLNLNYHDFDTPTVTVCVNACEEVQSISTSESYGGDDHDVMMMMAEIRSIGDQHEMEWNDHKMNLVTSAWWFNPDEEHFDEYCSTQEDYFQHPALPSLDIGEIEGLEDEEWLS